MLFFLKFLKLKKNQESDDDRLSLSWKMKGGFHLYRDFVWEKILLVSAILHFGILYWITMHELPPREDFSAVVMDMNHFTDHLNELTYIPKVKPPKMPDLPKAPTSLPAKGQSPPPNKGQSLSKEQPQKESVKRKGLLGLITSKKKSNQPLLNALNDDTNRDVKNILNEIDHVRNANRNFEVTSFNRLQVTEEKTRQSVDINGVGDQPLMPLKGINIDEKKASANVDVSGPIGVIGGIPGGTGYQEQVRTSVTANVSGVKYCYDRELKNNPKLTGTIVIEFSIDTQGKIIRYSVIEEASTLHDENVLACVLKRVKDWRFPKPETMAVFRFPFVFSRA